jgi:hypothetical protein
MNHDVSLTEIFHVLRALSLLDSERPGSPAATRTQARLALQQRLPTEIARHYDRLFDSGRRPTVVEAALGHCAGCHMRVPPQLMLVLTRAEVVCRCPSCHRFFSPPHAGPDERTPHA